MRYVIFFLLLLVGCNQRENAEYEARKFLATVYPGEPVRAVLCQPYDSDNNGYVSCTVRVGDQPPLALECAVEASWNDGCRIARMTAQP